MTESTVQKKVYIVVPLVGVGLLGVAYALYRKFFQPEEEVSAEEDLDLPLALEHDYGNYVSTCIIADPSASAYLNEFPEVYFHFNVRFATYVLNRFPVESKLGRILVSGSSTSALLFELSKHFVDVKGVEPSFSKVVTSYQFQNRKEVTYYFPLEGSFRTAEVSITPDKVFHDHNKRKNIIPLENVDIQHAHPGARMSYQIGVFQVLVLLKVLIWLEDPDTFLRRIHNFIQPDGFLIIVSDYDWPRIGNRHIGFQIPGVSTTFEFLKHVLNDEFILEDETNMFDINPISLRSCTIHNYHVTAWRRKVISDEDTLKPSVSPEQPDEVVEQS